MGNSLGIVSSLIKFADGFLAPQNTGDIGSKLAQPIGSEAEPHLNKGGAVSFGNKVAVSRFPRTRDNSCGRCTPV